MDNDVYIYFAHIYNNAIWKVAKISVADGNGEKKGYQILSSDYSNS